MPRKKLTPEEGEAARLRKNAKQRQRRQENHEELLAYEAAYREAHRTKKRTIGLAYYYRHHEKNLARGKTYDDAHREEKRARGRTNSRVYRSTHAEEVAAYMEDYRQRKAEELRAYSRNYAKAHPEQRVAAEARRRGRKNGALTSDLTHAQWLEIQAAQDHRCWYCGKRCKGKLTQDHIIPLSKGGSHTLHNVIGACRACNSKKHIGPPLTPVQPLLLTIAPATKKRKR
jgi:5-methylcytosine-specific restriction endonuclease McrA